MGEVEIKGWDIHQKYYRKCISKFSFRTRRNFFVHTFNIITNLSILYLSGVFFCHLTDHR